MIIRQKNILRALYVINLRSIFLKSPQQSFCFSSGRVKLWILVYSFNRTDKKCEYLLGEGCGQFLRLSYYLMSSDKQSCGIVRMKHEK